MAALRGRDGRILGPRGLATRAEILHAAGKHLEVTPWHLASIREVARGAGTSGSTFYQFFADLPEVVRVLAAAAGDDAPEHLRLIVELLDHEDKHLGAVADG